MRKQLLLPGDGMLIYHAGTGPGAARTGNSASSSFACQPGETLPANRLNSFFSDTGLTGKAPAANAPIPYKPANIRQTRAVSPAGLLPAGKIIAGQPVLAWRKAALRWSVPGPVQGILAGVFRLYNLVNAGHSIITLTYQRRWTHRRRPAYR